MRPASRPWWKQATALVSLSASGAVTGFSFAPRAPAGPASPASMPIRLLALEQAARPSPADDATLRAAIVNVARYYLQMARSKTPAEMEKIIWQQDSTDGADHGPSCAAFASLTLELAAQVTGQRSWVTGGSSYPWPLHQWADARVDPNPASPGIISIIQDAEEHHRWHPLGDGYTPLPGDWVLFDGHVEVVTQYADGVLQTIGGDSLPNFSVNAHSYRDPLSDQGVTGFVDNGELPGTGNGTLHAPGAAPAGTPGGDQTAPAPAAAPEAPGTQDASAVIPGILAAGPAGSAGSGGPASAHSAGSAFIPGLPAALSPGRNTRPQRQSQAQDSQPRQGQEPAPHASQAPAHASPESAGPAVNGGVPQPTLPAPATASQAAAPGGAAIPGLPPASPPPNGPPTSAADPHSAGQPPPATAPATAPVHGTRAQQAFIAEVAPGAVAAQRKYGVPAAVTIAQAIDESGWGRSELAVKDNNLFGIKGTGPAGSHLLPAREYENGQWITITAPFRVYRDVAESIDDHGRLLATSPQYSQAMAVRDDPNAFAAALTGTYATDPHYGATLINLMRQYDLYRFDAMAPGGYQPQGPSGQPDSTASGRQASAAPSATRSPEATAAPRTVPPGGAAIPGLAVIPGLADAASATPASTQPAAPAPAPAASLARPAPGDGSQAEAGGSQAETHQPQPRRASQPRRAAQPRWAAQPRRAPQPRRAAQPWRAPRPRTPASKAGPASRPAKAEPGGCRVDGSVCRNAPARPSRYQAPIPTAVRHAFLMTARTPLIRGEALYRDVASHSGIPWELLAACDWMQCEARARYSPVHGEKLGTVNPDGTVYRTKSAALAQCADDLAELAWAVYGIDLTAGEALSVRDLADAFAAFRWGGLLKRHRTSAMEFPYSMAGLTDRHMSMRWPAIAEPDAPDKPGSRFRRPFGAVPIVLSLSYPATV